MKRQPPDLHSLAARLAIAVGRSRVGELPGQHLARWLLVVIILVNVLSASSLWLFSAQAAATHASTDLTARLSTIQKLVQGDNIFGSSNLSLLQTQVSEATADLNALHGSLPFDGNVGIPSISLLSRNFLVAEDFLAAIQDLLQASRAIQPNLTALLISALGVAPVHAGNGPLPYASIYQALDTVGLDVSSAESSWQSAETLLPSLGYSSAQDALGISASTVNAITQYLRNNLYQLNTIISISIGFFNSLPAMLGIYQPEFDLLLYLDPNQLLPTGGIASSYATFAVAQGTVISAPQFHSTVAFDCLHGCVADGLGELTNNPDYVLRADEAESALLSKLHIHIHGVIAITPDFIADILRILGPVRVPELGLTVSAGNIRSENARYDANVVSSAASGAGTSPDTSGFAIAVMSSLERAVAGASHAQLLRIGSILVRELYSKHLLIFTNYPSIEQQLVALLIGGLVINTNDRDTLYIADGDRNEDYNSSSISETVSDRVTLSRSGTAAHALSITYRYALPAATAESGTALPYHDLQEVMVPIFATKLVDGGPCVSRPLMTQPYNAVLACELVISPGASETVHMSWVVTLPTLFAEEQYYELEIERQPGAQVSTTIAMLPGPGLTLSPDASNQYVEKGAVVWTSSPLQVDTVLSVHYRLSG